MERQNDMIESLRIKYWRKILKLDEFRKHLTWQVFDELNKKIGDLSHLDITLENVQLLLNGIMQNSTQIFIDSLVDFFMTVTKHHIAEYSKNIHYYNGWKSNDSHKINKKIIIPYRANFFSKYYFDRDAHTNYEHYHSDVKNSINEIIKAFELLTGKTYQPLEYLDTHTYGNDLLKFKTFYKGTIHIWFKDLDALNHLNFFVGQQLNWIPTTDEILNNDKAKSFVSDHFKEIKNNSLLLHYARMN